MGDLGLPPDLQISGIAVLTHDLSTHPAKYAMRHRIPYTSIATQAHQAGAEVGRACGRLRPRRRPDVGQRRSADSASRTSFVSFLCRPDHDVRPS